MPGQRDSALGSAVDEKTTDECQSVPGGVDGDGQMCPPRNQARQLDREGGDLTIHTGLKVVEKELETNWMARPSQIRAGCCGAQHYQSMATRNGGCPSKGVAVDLVCRMMSMKVAGTENRAERHQEAMMDQSDHVAD